MTELTENLKQLRKSYNLTQKEIAEKLHIATTTYQTYEQGACEPNIDILKNLSKFYKVSIDDIVNNDYKSLLSKEKLDLQSLIMQLNQEYTIQAIFYVKSLLQYQNANN